MLVIPTGYMSSGSSAITDLLSEFDCFSSASDNPDDNTETRPYGSQEFIFMHCPYGILDLEKSLLNPISHLSSDEAIKKFREMMEKLYYLKGWWPSYYNEYISPDFMQYVDDYLDELTDYKFRGFWYMDEIPTQKPFLKKVENRLKGIKYLDNATMNLAYPDEEKFVKATKKFIDKILNDLAKGKENVIIDQLLLPYNEAALNKYFDNTKMIIVERDPRDVFVLNSKIDAVVPFPTEARAYAKFYKRLRELSAKQNNKNILYVKFEDLIYKYNDTVKTICKFLNIDESLHTRIKTKCIPEKSIDNTQLFRVYDKEEDIKIIERELKDYLYDFPYVYDKKERNIF